MLFKFNNLKKGQVSNESLILIFLLGLYALSFFLPVGDHMPGWMAFVYGTCGGLATIFYHSGSCITMSPLIGIAGLGNIFMLLAIFFHRKNFVRYGLTAQFALLVYTAVLTIASSSHDLGVGYYLWIGTQIGMCLLLWYIWFLKNRLGSQKVENNMNEPTNENKPSGIDPRLIVLFLFVLLMVGLFLFSFRGSFKPKQVVNQQQVVYPSAQYVSPRQRVYSTPVAQDYRPQGIIQPEAPPRGPMHAPTVFGPHIFNIDFGVWRPQESPKVGPAADGRPGDYWNTIGVAWNNDHTEFDLRSAQGEWSPIQARLINLAGGWGSSDRMGVKDQMLNTFNYPQNNQGGNSQVILKNVPPGSYHLYIYGHGTDPAYYGDYTLSVSGRDYGRKSTSNNRDAIDNTRWVEGSQYVKFTNVNVGQGEEINILIHPGGHMDAGFADAIICGLQLIPVNQSYSY